MKHYAKPDPNILLYNRIEFKLYAASYYLDQIKDFQKDHAGLHNDMKSVHMEIAIDGFVSSLYGAIDSLFVLINDKLNLGIPLERITGSNVKQKLESIGRENLLFEWEMVRQEGQWLHDLSEFRHQIIHRERLRRMREYNPWNGEAVQYISRKQRKISLNTSDYIPDDMITYFERSLSNVNDLITTIRSKDPALQIQK